MKKGKSVYFSAEEVRAAREGRKTQFRRVLNFNIKDCSESHKNYEGAHWKNEPMQFENHNGEWYCSLCGNGVNYGGDAIRSPFGNSGDMLWVKESFYRTTVGYSLYKADAEGDQLFLGIDEDGPVYAPVSDYPWKSPILMTSDDSRIQMVIEKIRVEHLQDISEDDAISEGVRYMSDEFGYSNYGKYVGLPMRLSAVQSFQALWDDTHGKPRKGKKNVSWKSNPLVWVVDFHLDEKQSI